jgi:hypothetical protein
MGYLILAGLALAYALGYVTPKRQREDRLTDDAMADILSREQNRYFNGKL